MASQNNYNSNVKDHWPQITLTNTTIIKKSLKYFGNYQIETETQSEQILLGKWCQYTCSMQDCHKPSIYFLKKQYLQSAVKHGMPVYSLKTRANISFLCLSQRVFFPITCSINFCWTNANNSVYYVLLISIFHTLFYSALRFQGLMS